ncbi:hypothetical protein BJX66DRAFT_295361 [Aspergillus keveii]|uniref:Uncharacterized protein n=1 Tax=Aspergillus keveii TaxID=714993 RepID=A0ABR4GIA5_9EURO
MTSTALASPLSQNDLEARDIPESVFLVNCAGGQSFMEYFPAGPNPHGAPPPQDLCNLGRIVHWEGETHSCRFPTGVTFTSHIVSYAASKAVGEYAGFGNNGSPWTCYRGSQRNLLGQGCINVYYCNKS